MKKNILIPLSFIFLISLASYVYKDGTIANHADYKNKLTFKPGEENKIIEAFLMLEDSTHILLKAGNYQFENLSIAQVKHILIQGEGHDKTILDFKSQSQGGEGIRVTNVDDFTIDGMSIKDSKGDLLKVNNGNGVKISNLHAFWSKADSTSGGYAIYPVLCKNVLIEKCFTSGSSDAGIYVGQSDSAIVRKCIAVKNVAGCEIENTSNAEVYDNEFYNNTAGFLVFDLPGLSKRGGHVRAYNNNIHDNNFKNFAKAGSFGTTWGVGNAAPGSGVIILAASNISIYNNKIINNNSTAISLVSGFTTDPNAAAKINENYFPISKNIKVYNNILAMGPKFPVAAYHHRTGELMINIEKKLNQANPARKNKRIPYILYDGISTNLLTGKKDINPDSICINQKETNHFVNADFLNFENRAKWKPNLNIKPFKCN